MAKTAKQNRGKTLRRVKKGIAKASKRFVKNVKQLSMRGRKIFGRAKKMKIWGGEHKGKKVVLLIIDPQNDFTDIDATFKKLVSKEGLPVVGAEGDFTKIITMLNSPMGELIDEIHISLDSHNDTHIGHVGFWKRSDNEPVEPGVVFKVEIVENADGTKKKKIVNKHKYEAAVKTIEDFHKTIKDFRKTIEEYRAKNKPLQEVAIKYEKMEAAVKTIKDFQAQNEPLQEWAIKYKDMEAAVKTIEEYQAQNEPLQEWAIKYEDMKAAGKTINYIEDYEAQNEPLQKWAIKYEEMKDAVKTINNEEYQAQKPELQEWAIKYIENMAKNGKPDPLIWNKHCIKGSEGWMVYQDLWDAIITWRDTRKNGNNPRKLYVHEKGGNDLCEMYSIMQAEVTYEDLLATFDPEAQKNIISTFDTEAQNKLISTQHDVVNPIVPCFDPVLGGKLEVNPRPNLATNFNQPLYDALCGTPDNQNILLICGEAKSHCVKSSATDIVEKMKNTRHTPNHVYILDDAMSSVQLLNDPKTNALFAGFSDKFIQNMHNNQANITKTTDVLKLLDKL